MTATLHYLKAIIIVCLLILSGTQGVKVYQHYQDKQIVQATLVEKLSAKVRLQDISGELIKWVGNEIFGKDPHKLNTYTQALHATQQKIHNASLWFLAFALGVIVVNFWHFHARIFSLSTAALSLLCLAVGLTTPVLTIESTQNLPILGETILQFESKSIWGSIQKLLFSDSWLVGYILLSFSIILPLLKSSVILWANLAPKHTKPYTINKVLSYLGKWSMADVFIVAILVVFFAGSQHSLTQSTLEYGIYFFGTYVILSMLAQHSTGHTPNT